ncbi:4'-phosphopantetheinyl transferase superfamily protein [Streptomyces nojiriensis]
MARGHRIGVDVEHLGRGAAALDGIVEGFPRAERDWIGAAPRGRARIRRALRLWTLRQAYAKACDAEGGAEGGAAERGAEGGAGPDAAAPPSTYTFTRADEGGTFAFTVDGRGRATRTGGASWSSSRCRRRSPRSPCGSSGRRAARRPCT